MDPLSVSGEAAGPRRIPGSINHEWNKLCFPDVMAVKRKEARLWFVRGRVQGVGYRYFAQKQAWELGLTGYTRNLDDGRVEVYAVGLKEKLEEMAARLYRGPRWSDVRGVDEQEAAVQECSAFEIEA